MAKMHLCAFSESQDAAAAFVLIAGVADKFVKVIGDRIYVPKDLNKIIGEAAFVGTTGVDAKLESPSLRQVNPLYIKPTVELLVPPATHPEWLHPDKPIQLDTDEGLEAYENADPAAAEQHTVVVLLADEAPAPVAGDIRTIRATATITCVAGAWTFGELTLVEELVTGRYAIVGADVFAANTVAFRFFPKGGGNQPGGLVTVDMDDIVDSRQRKGGLGTWLEFDTVQLPGIELLGSAAGAASAVIYLDVVKVG